MIKKTDNSDSNNKNNDSEDSDDEIYNMDHDLLYPSANTTPEWYVSKIENVVYCVTILVVIIVKIIFIRAFLF